VGAASRRWRAVRSTRWVTGGQTGGVCALVYDGPADCSAVHRRRAYPDGPADDLPATLRPTGRPDRADQRACVHADRLGSPRRDTASDNAGVALTIPTRSAPMRRTRIGAGRHLGFPVSGQYYDAGDRTHHSYPDSPNVGRYRSDPVGVGVVQHVCVCGYNPCHAISSD
jgi:hypothetical protein